MKIITLCIFIKISKRDTFKPKIAMALMDHPFTDFLFFSSCFPAFFLYLPFPIVRTIIFPFFFLFSITYLFIYLLPLNKISKPLFMGIKRALRNSKDKSAIIHIIPLTLPCYRPCHSRVHAIFNFLAVLSSTPFPIISAGLFAVRCGDHLRFWDHLRSWNQLRHCTVRVHLQISLVDASLQ